MRFDYAIMNPPYDRNLHLKFLEKVIKVAGKTVNISPVRWLQDPFARYIPKSDLNKFKDSIAKHIESLEIISAKQGSGLFDIFIGMNLGIYVCTEKGGYDYKHINPIAQKIVDKTRESNWLPYNQKDFYNKGCKQEKPYVLNVSSMRTKESDDQILIMCKTYESQLNTNLTNKATIFSGGSGLNATHFEFDTEEERKNFYDCYTSLFMRWTYRLWKFDQRIVSAYIPYFGDYTKPWTNARFCEYFGITGFISDTEAEPGSEWETILETMKKYAK